MYTLFTIEETKANHYSIWVECNATKRTKQIHVKVYPHGRHKFSVGMLSVCHTKAELKNLSSKLIEEVENFRLQRLNELFTAIDYNKK